jgi:Zn finger protein HypA/HybF involved in hydrogenase expression
MEEKPIIIKCRKCRWKGDGLRLKSPWADGFEHYNDELYYTCPKCHSREIYDEQGEKVI